MEYLNTETDLPQQNNTWLLKPEINWMIISFDMPFPSLANSIALMDFMNAALALSMFIAICPPLRPEHFDNEIEQLTFLYNYQSVLWSPQHFKFWF